MGCVLENAANMEGPLSVAHHPLRRSPFWKDECSSQSSLIVWNGSTTAITPLPTATEEPASGFLDRGGQEMQSSDKWTPENDAASLEPHSQGDLAAT